MIKPAIISNMTVAKKGDFFKSELLVWNSDKVSWSCI